ncbi:MAG: DM13 domain-containing protein [Actinomycetota bacterium]|nr:DM13 domain-containing protein [Actinomycetota bacterium]
MTESNGPSRSRLRFLRHPVTIAGLVVLIVAVGFAAYWFQPWKLFTTTTVDEAPPAVAAGPDGAGPQVTATGAAVTEVVAQGDLVSQEHDTSGTVQLLRLPDESLVVRVADLETSDGPDLKVWLTDAPVTPGLDGAGVFDDGRWVDLGSLKGNRGSANYPVPAGTDVDGLSSVSIWCDRFNVSFGAAELTPST